MIAPATSSLVAASIPSRPGEELTSITSGPSLPSSMSTPATRRPMICAARTAARSYSASSSTGSTRAAAVHVGAELVALRDAPHRRHHAVADDQGADVAALALADEPLDQDVLPGALQRLDDRLGDLAVGARITPMPWVPSSSLITTGAPPTRSIAGITSARSRTKVVAGIAMLWRDRICVARSLSRAVRDAVGGVGRVDVHLLELAHDGGAEVGDRVADAGQHRVVRPRAACRGTAGRARRR